MNATEAPPWHHAAHSFPSGSSHVAGPDVDGDMDATASPTRAFEGLLRRAFGCYTPHSSTRRPSTASGDDPFQSCVGPEKSSMTPAILTAVCWSPLDPQMACKMSSETPSEHALRGQLRHKSVNRRFHHIAKGAKRSKEN